NVSKRLIVLTDFEKEYILINPEIIARSEQVENDVEGCLSLPGYQGRVDRALKVVVRAIDLEGRSVQITSSGFLARVLQHEIDHLNGILYIDRADPDSLVLLPESEDGKTMPVELADMQTFFHKTDHRNRQDIVFERTQDLD
ncbi:peptide deformylase, partial [candidate division KSB1 bacterium]|nr:peptide deformylase [candidate division KSB1 bacterium]